MSSADYKPFNFESIPQDSVSQQAEFDYMLQYKLWGTDYIQMGRRVKIPDKSGWNGSRGPITSAEGISLGGPVLTSSTITLGDQCPNVNLINIYRYCTLIIDGTEYNNQYVQDHLNDLRILLDKIRTDILLEDMDV